MKKPLMIAGCCLVAAFLGWRIYRTVAGSPGGPAGRPAGSAVAVETAPVRTAAIHEVRRFTGTLLPAAEFVLAPKTAGRLHVITVDFGDAVRPGQEIALLEDTEYRQAVDQARASLSVAGANLEERENGLENTRREYQRTLALRQRGIASASELDAAEMELKSQEARLKVAKAQVLQETAALDIAETRLSETRIQMPETPVNSHFVVGERFVDPGALLAANTPIVSILDIGRLLASVHVIERDYPRIRPGLEALLTTDAFPGEHFTGKVIRIAPLLKETSRQARVEIEIVNEDLRLKPGMFVKAEIALGRKASATVVPVTALVKRDGVDALFVVDPEKSRVHLVPVTPGIVTETQAEILSPAVSGSVVTLGHHLLEDGAAIRLSGAAPSPPGETAP